MKTYKKISEEDRELCEIAETLERKSYMTRAELERQKQVLQSRIKEIDEALKVFNG